MNLFEKVPESFFSVLSRKYKSVYAYALLALFDTLRTYKSKIRKADYINSLRAHGEDIMALFDVDLDKLDDKPDEEEIPYAVDESALNSKTNYIFRKLVATGWIYEEKDLATNAEYLYLPAYAIKMLEYISDICSDTALYVPLVHQTYSELSLEDQKEDDYMFRSLVGARKNAEELELNVTLLHHSICVFGNTLSSVFDPNEILRQHFDVFRSEVSDRIYHPMKTYDSLSLYSLPVITVLRRWQRDSRIMAKLCAQAKYDPSLAGLKATDLYSRVSEMLQQTSDIFERLSSSFDEIDRANARYTKDVQKKVNFLSASDKTIKGKLDSIILAIAKRLEGSESGLRPDYDNLDIIGQASQTISILHQGFVSSDSLTMPFRRGEQSHMDPLPLEDAYQGDDDLMNAFLETEVNRFSYEAVVDFMLRAFNDRDSIETKDIDIPDMDHLVLLILGTVRAEFGEMFFTIEKIGPVIDNGKFLMPDYRFVRKES